MAKQEGSPASKLPLQKKLLFALIPAVVIFTAAELVLRVIDFQSPVADPYESFVLHKPLFTLDGDTFHTATSRHWYFHDQSLAKAKPTDVVRFFAVGGSTTYGSKLPDPLQDNYSALLARELENENPGLRFEAINCGGIAYASYRLVGIVEECLAYSPDFIIVMTGHNEFLEARHYRELLAGSRQLWYHLRLAHFMLHLRERLWPRAAADLQQSQDGKMALAADYIAERYIVRDDREIRYTLEHYTQNLERIAELCREHKTPLVLCTVPSNLRDWEPFATEPGGGLTVEQLDNYLDQLRSLFDEQQHDKALTLSRTVVEQDPRSAIFHFIAAECLVALGRKSEARESYVLAKDTDAFPHRALSSFNNSVREIASGPLVYLFDAEALFAAESPDGIPGNNLFLDNCHPNPGGHDILAQALKEIVLEHILKGD
jgi:lysophospholipase L1-like esterase